MDFITSFTPVIEIFVIAIVFNYLLSFFWNTRSMDLLLGVLAFLIIFVITSLLNLPILYTIMTNLFNVAAIAILIIFQPELRVALSKLSLKGKRYRKVKEFDKFLDQLTSSVYKMAEKRIGALIVLEHEDNLDEFAEKAVLINGLFSSELLETIFDPSTPLHDGAVIIRDLTIVAAAVILPLAEGSSEVTRSTGTRHRAALGLSQTTDALIITISEQAGMVSLSRENSVSREVRTNQFKGIIRSIFAPPETTSLTPKFTIRKWLKTR